jgi:hypothetical protein
MCASSLCSSFFRIHSADRIFSPRAATGRDENVFLSLVVFEILHLTQALLGGGLAFVRPAQIFTRFGDYLVTGFHFSDHGISPPVLIFGDQ